MQLTTNQDYGMPETGRWIAMSPDTKTKYQGKSSGGLPPQGGWGRVHDGVPPRFRYASNQRGVDNDTGMVQGLRLPPTTLIQSDHRPYAGGEGRAVPARTISRPTYTHGRDPINFWGIFPWGQRYHPGAT